MWDNSLTVQKVSLEGIVKKNTVTLPRVGADGNDIAKQLESCGCCPVQGEKGLQLDTAEMGLVSISRGPRVVEYWTPTDEFVFGVIGYGADVRVTTSPAV